MNEFEWDKKMGKFQENKRVVRKETEDSIEKKKYGVMRERERRDDSYSRERERCGYWGRGFT